MRIIQVMYKPPLRCDTWHHIHYTQGLKTPEEIEKYLAAHNLHPDEVYMDKGGSIWVPIERKGE